MNFFNATPNSLSTLYVSKRPYSKGKYPKINQPYSQSFKGKNKPIFSNLNNYDLYITKKNKMFLMQEMVHGIKDGRIKMAKHKANAMQSNIIIRN
jgi:S-ribosylhomocysteine lyase LuxS involved in autoinducer biosynthesis